MPVIYRQGALQFFFYSNEGNPREPPHVHVREGRHEAKFWLRPEVTLCYNDSLDARTLRQVRATVEQRRDEFEQAWHVHFGS